MTKTKRTRRGWWLKKSFADLPLTKLTDSFYRTRSETQRLKILNQALPLCATVPDVRMFWSGTKTGSVARALVSRRWDKLVMYLAVTQMHDWMQARDLYNQAREGSEVQKSILIYWQMIGPIQFAVQLR